MSNNKFATGGKALLWQRIIPSGLLCLTILVFFWSSSRYPALNDKAGMSMGGRVHLESLGFEQILFAGPDSMLLWQVLATFVNWAYTNKNGMIFGLVFGAAFLTFLRYLSLGRSRSHLINTLKGILIGAPMGVCANCAAPIGQGMYAAGEKIETVLASMVSSPTLNVVVLSLAIGLFPIEMAVTKILLTAVVLLIIVPLIAVYIKHNGGPIQYCDIASLDAEDNTEEYDESWRKATVVVLGQFYANLLYIASKTLPLMIFAGLLGSLAIELFPMENFTTLQVGFITILVAGLLGTFLPVPIAFDVVIASALMQAGLPPAFAMVLLFTLGTYSIYPLSIIWRSMSRFAALALFLAVAGLGMAGGFVIEVLGDKRDQQILGIFEQQQTGSETATPKPNQLENWQNLIVTGCAKFPNPELKTRCNIVSTIFLVQQNRTPELCDSLQVAGQRLMCHHETLGAVYADTLSATDFRRKCEGLVRGSAAIDQCLLQIADQYQRDDLCALLSSDAATRSCQKNVAINQFSDSGDLQGCSEMKTEREVAHCREGVVFSQATRSSNTALCEQLQNPESIQHCKTVTLLRRMMTGAKSPDICLQLSQLGNVRLADDCRLYIAAASAVTSGEPEQCAAMQDPRVIGICYQQMLSMIKFFINKLYIPANTASFITTLSNEVAQGSSIRRSASQRGEKEPGTVVGPAPSLESITVLAQESIEVYRIAHQKRVSKGSLPFLRLEGSDIGMAKTESISPLDFDEPFVYGRGIASGDFNNDNWPDLILATDKGVRLFQNLGNGEFAQVPIKNDRLQALDVFAVALPDINNDGLSDIYVSSYGGENIFLINDGNSFRSSPVVLSLPRHNQQRLLTMASAFGDLDRDGDLDIMLGNWSFGAAAEYNPVYSANELFLNQGKYFESAPLAGLRGETLSILMSDIDGDRDLDILVANDGPAPDVVYRQQDHIFEREKFGSSSIPVTPWYSMSYDSGDINNDLMFDIFSTDMSFSRSAHTDYCEPIENRAARRKCTEGLVLRDIHKNYEISKCGTIENPALRAECRTAILIRLAVQKKQPELCRKISDNFSSKRRFCEERANLRNEDDLQTQVSAEYLPQIRNNVLLVSDSGTFENRAKEMGVEASFWSWNSKFVDLNNDGWLDIYIGNGYLFNPQEIHSNVFFLNQRGKGFEIRQKEYGLEDYMHTSSWTSLDLDLDGDLDLVTTGMLAPLRIWMNNDTDHNSIRFAFRDYRGNRSGIGNKITIYYGEGGQQIREIKASGGFLSFDEPVAHFGLDQEVHVDRAVIDWSTGERTEINTPLTANATYIIQRAPSGRTHD